MKKELDATEPRTRRHDVLKDILVANDYQAEGENRAAEVKRFLELDENNKMRVKDDAPYHIKDTHMALNRWWDLRRPGKRLM